MGGRDSKQPRSHFGGLGQPARAARGSAVYVAPERINGKLAGKSGNFILVHHGVMTRGTPSLKLEVAPDSGTGELAGLSGQMQIDIKDGQHFYRFEYELRA